MQVLQIASTLAVLSVVLLCTTTVRAQISPFKFVDDSGFGASGETVLEVSPDPYATLVDIDGDRDEDVVLQAEDRAIRVYKKNGASYSLMDKDDLGQLGEYEGAYEDSLWEDFDNDGRVDVLIVHTRGTRPRLFLQQEDGTFNTAQGGALTQKFCNYSGGAELDFCRISEVYAEDIDGDNQKDLFLVVERTESEQSSVAFLAFKGAGDGTFTRFLENQLTIPFDFRLARFADMDNDGDLDVSVVESNGQRKIHIWENSLATPPNRFLAVTVTGDLADRQFEQGTFDMQWRKKQEGPTVKPDLFTISESGDVSQFVNDGFSSEFNRDPSIQNPTILPGAEVLEEPKVAYFDLSLRSSTIEFLLMDSDAATALYYFDRDDLEWKVASLTAPENFKNTTAHGYCGSVETSATFLADLNSDGDLDLALYCKTSGETSTTPGQQFWIALYDGDRFDDVPTITTSTLNTYDFVFPYGWRVSTVAADFDSDGDLDVLSVGFGPHEPFVFYTNDGEAEFTQATAVSSSDEFYVTRMDLVTIGGASNAVLVSQWFGEPFLLTYDSDDGGFDVHYFNVTENDVSVALDLGGVVDIEACDLDGDSDLDIILLRPFYETAILINGGGSVDDDSIYFTDLDPRVYNYSSDVTGWKDTFMSSVSCADYNEDGYGDLAIAIDNRQSDSNYEVYATFPDFDFELLSTSQLPRTKSRWTYIEFLDMDLDGDIDIYVVSRNGKTNVQLLYDLLSDQFTRIRSGYHVQASTHSMKFISFDYNLDNEEDIILINSEQLSATDPMTPLLQNQGDQRFGLVSRSGIPDVNSFGDVVYGDFDDDGDDDLIFARFADYWDSSAKLAYYRNSNGFTVLFEDSGSEISDYVLANFINAYAGTFIDLNNDGLDDVLLSTGTEEINAMFLATSGDSFEAIDRTDTSALEPYPFMSDLNPHTHYALVDINDDGRRDLYVSVGDVGDDLEGTDGLSFVDQIYTAGEDGSWTVFEGSFPETESRYTSRTFWDDLDGDNDVDGVGFHPNDGVSVYEHTGSATWTMKELFPVMGTKMNDGTMVDLNDDGKLDLITVGKYDPKLCVTVHLNWNNGSLGFDELTIPTGGDILAATEMVKVFTFDYDADGDVDILAVPSQYRQNANTLLLKNELNEGRTFDMLTVQSGNNPFDFDYDDDHEGTVNDVISVDFNGDHKRDLLVATGASSDWPEGTATNLLFVNNGNGNYTQSSEYNSIFNTDTTTTLGYLNGAPNSRDGHLSFLIELNLGGTSVVNNIVRCFRDGDEVCGQCPTGYRGVKGGCTPCRRGYYGSSRNSTTCAVCHAGPYYQPDLGASSCVECSSGTYTLSSASYARAQCLSCGDNTSPNDIAAINGTCSCESLFYRVGTFGACTACPTDGSATCTDSTIYPNAGYWWNTSLVTDSSIPSIVECPYSNACDGGAEATCVDGHGGVACAVCDTGYFLIYGSCTQCESETASTVIIALLGVGALIAIFLLYRLMVSIVVHRIEQYIEKKKELQRKGKSFDYIESYNMGGDNAMSVMTATKAVITFYQESNAIMEVFEDVIPTSYSDVQSKLQVVNIDIFAFGSPSCANYGIEYTYLESVVAYAVILLIGVALLYMYYFIYSCVMAGRSVDPVRSRRRSKVLRVARNRAVLFLIYLMYVPLSVRIFGTLDCEYLGEKEYLTSDYSIACDSTKYKAYRSVAIVLMIVFSLGVPFTYFILLFAYRKRFARPDLLADRPSMNAQRISVTSQLKNRDQDEDAGGTAVELENMATPEQKGSTRTRVTPIELCPTEGGDDSDISPDGNGRPMQITCGSPLRDSVTMGTSSDDPSKRYSRGSQGGAESSATSLSAPSGPVRPRFVGDVRRGSSLMENIRMVFTKIRGGTATYHHVLSRFTLQFLYENYRPERYYWECIEMSRRLVMTSVVIFLGTNSAERWFSAQLFSFVFIMIVTMAHPQRRRSDFHIQRLGMCAIFLQLLIIGGFLNEVFVATNAEGYVMMVINFSVALAIGSVLVYFLYRKWKAARYSVDESKPDSPKLSKKQKLKAKKREVVGRALRHIRDVFNFSRIAEALDNIRDYWGKPQEEADLEQKDMIEAEKKLSRA